MALRPERHDPSYEQLLTHERRMRAMLADPALHGELLIVGIALARLVDMQPEKPRKLRDIALLAYPCPPHTHGPLWEGAAVEKLRKVLAGDARRYEPPPASGRCTAPGADRDKLCGAPADGEGATITDHVSGAREHRQACNAHAPWLRNLIDQNTDDLQHATAAAFHTPPPNTGGVLPRHLPELPWSLLWSACRPDWVAPLYDPATFGPIRAVPGYAETTAAVRGHLRAVPEASQPAHLSK